MTIIFRFLHFTQNTAHSNKLRRRPPSIIVAFIASQDGNPIHVFMSPVQRHLGLPLFLVPLARPSWIILDSPTDDRLYDQIALTSLFDNS